MLLKPGDLLDDRYVLVRELGRGGQGEVWLATDGGQANLSVAIKTVPVGVRRSTAPERLTREARALLGFQHPQVPRFHRFFLDGKAHRFGLAMDFVEGAPLRERAGLLSPGARQRVLHDCAAVLAAAHARGIVHRDVKPGNLLLTPHPSGAHDDYGRLVLVDFGIAAHDDHAPLTAASTLLGTPSYLPPEALAPQRFPGDRRAPTVDVFAWGLLAHLLFTGRHPVPGEHGFDPIVGFYLTLNPADWLPALGGPWGTVIAEALALDPTQRPRDGGALLARLARLGLAGEATVTETGNEVATATAVTADVRGVAEARASAPSTPVTTAPSSPGPERTEPWPEALPRRAAADAHAAAGSFHRQSGWHGPAPSPMLQSHGAAPGAAAPHGPPAQRAYSHALPGPTAPPLRRTTTEQKLAAVLGAAAVAALLVAARDCEAPLLPALPALPAATPPTRETPGTPAVDHWPDRCQGSTDACCCPSGHGCGERPCSEPLSPSDKLALRPSGVSRLRSREHLWEFAPGGKQCLRVPRTAETACIPAEETRPGARAGQRLLVTVRDLNAGVEYWAEDVQGNVLVRGVTQAPRGGAFLRSVLCNGFSHRPDGVHAVSFFADPPSRSSPALCGSR